MCAQQIDLRLQRGDERTGGGRLQMRCVNDAGDLIGERPASVDGVSSVVVGFGVSSVIRQIDVWPKSMTLCRLSTIVCSSELMSCSRVTVRLGEEASAKKLRRRSSNAPIVSRLLMKMTRLEDCSGDSEHSMPSTRVSNPVMKK